MQTWMQPTTAPKQPDLATDEQVVVEGDLRAERGWMEQPQQQPHTQMWFSRRRGSIGITVLAASVAIGFVLATVVLAPLMLRWLAS